MKAITHTRFGPPDLLEFRDVAKPTPKADEVLVRVHAASLNAYDWHIMRAKPFIVRLAGFGLLKPKRKILGVDMAGRVEAVGPNVKHFKAHDEVYGDLSGCGGGAFAEYVCAPENVLAAKPANVSFEEAAAVPMAGVTALQGLRDKGKVQPGQKVLIHGASGGVGTFAVQLAKSFGAELTGVCSTRSVEIARSIGADHVIDYTKEDFTQNGQQYDLILAANGDRPLSDYKRALGPRGTYVMSGGSMRQIFSAVFLGRLMSRRGGKTMRMVAAKPSRGDLIVIKELMEAGKVRPVIDRRYPLAQVPDAMQYLEEGHARGKIVITM